MEQHFAHWKRSVDRLGDRNEVDAERAAEFQATNQGLQRSCESVKLPDDHDVNPAGVKGIGELANVGTAAAVANAVYHAIGIRIRELPIRIEKLLDA